MVLKRFSFFIGKKKINLITKKVSIFSFGLMFKKRSPILLWEMTKERNLGIFSLFCRPFVAIWLDKNRRVLKISSIKDWKFAIPGFGEFLLEIPESDVNYLIMTKMAKKLVGEKKKGLNTKII
jgi:hypothetical protein